MEFKESTFDEIIESEKEMFLTASQRYGKYFDNAYNFVIFLNDFLVSINPDRYIFGMFLSQVRKHATLALFSIVRRHHVQAMMNIRQLLEGGACAAYAIANTDKNDFADIKDDGTLDTSQKLSNKRYKWLDENFSHGSQAIKAQKDIINSSTAHSNIVNAHGNFELDEKTGAFHTPFFDIEDEYLIKTDLWQLANITMGLLDLFYGVNQSIDLVNFKSDFLERLKVLEQENNILKSEMMEHERYKRITEKRE